MESNKKKNKNRSRNKPNHQCAVIALVVFFVCVVLLAPHSEAQQSSMRQTRQSIATVIFSGLGGAVLGLSTLSFYGQPQEHLSNISAGFALGIVGGSIFVATQSMQDAQAGRQQEVSQNIDPKVLYKTARAPIFFAYSFEF